MFILTLFGPNFLKLNNEKNWELQKSEKAQASVLVILSYFFSLLFTTALFKLKIVISIVVKSTRKILYP